MFEKAQDNCKAGAEVMKSVSHATMRATRTLTKEKIETDKRLASRVKASLMFQSGKILKKRLVQVGVSGILKTSQTKLHTSKAHVQNEPKTNIHFGCVSTQSRTPLISPLNILYTNYT